MINMYRSDILIISQPVGIFSMSIHPTHWKLFCWILSKYNIVKNCAICHYLFCTCLPGQKFMPLIGIGSRKKAGIENTKESKIWIKTLNDWMQHIWISNPQEQCYRQSVLFQFIQLILVGGQENHNLSQSWENLRAPKAGLRNTQSPKN